MNEKTKKYSQIAIGLVVSLIFALCLVSVFGIEKSIMSMYWILPFIIFSALGPERLERLHQKFLDIPATIFGSIAVLITLSICVAVAVDPLAGIPKIQDEINYFFQGKILTTGHVSVDTHPLADFFQYRFFVNDGKMYSLFQPGWPLLLGLGYRLGAAWIVAPLLASVSVGFFFGVGRRLFGEAVGRWSVISLITCTVFLFQSSSMMAHGPALAFALVALYASLRGLENNEGRWFFIAGLAGGALFSIRAATAFALILPVAIAGLWLVYKRALEVKSLLILALGFAPGVLFQALYNLSLSGSILTFPQDHYFNLTEATKNCHRLGIGKGIGCAYEHGPDLGKNGFTWQRALEVTRIRLNFFRYDLFDVGFGVALIFLPLFTKTSKAKFLLLGIPLSLISVYFFYYYHAESRYYFESIPFCFLLIVLGFKGLLEALENSPKLVKRFGYGFILTSFFTLSAFSLLTLPQKWTKYTGYWAHHKKVAAGIQGANLKNAVIFVPKADRMYWTGFWLNDADLKGEVIIAVDQGREANRQLITYYPSRDFYKINYSGKLQKLSLQPSPKKITIEAEGKFPVPIRENGYALSQSLRPWKIYSSQLLFDAKQVGAFMTFHQYIFEDGTYEISGRFGNGPDYGVFKLEIEGQLLEPEYDGFSSKIELKNWKSKTQVKLKKGLRKITLRIGKKNPASTSYVAGIDKLILTKVD